MVPLAKFSPAAIYENFFVSSTSRINVHRFLLLNVSVNPTEFFFVRNESNVNELFLILLLCCFLSVVQQSISGGPGKTGRSF